MLKKLKKVRPPKPAPLPELLSVAEVAERLGVSIPTVYRYINKGHPRAGKLTATRVGGTTIIQSKAVDWFKHRLEDE